LAKRFRPQTTYFFFNSEKEISKKIPPWHPGFYFALKDKSRKIRVPSSLPIFVVAANKFEQAMPGPKGEYQGRYE